MSVSTKIIAAGALALALTGCTRPVGEPTESRIRTACAVAFPDDSMRRFECREQARYSYVRQRNYEALSAASSREVKVCLNDQSCVVQ